MEKIAEKPISELAGISYDCTCGNHHTVDIKKIIVGSGVLHRITEIAAPFKEGRVLMISDQNTYRVAGQKVEEYLKVDGFNVKSHSFDSGEDFLIPDEKVLGRIFMELDNDITLIVAVGSGSINDLCKYVSARSKVPYVIVATAPSMDGYAADGAPMICNGFKISFVAHLPYGILADVDVLKEAPMRMILAGFGDVLGKYTALAEWKLTNVLTGEGYCADVASLVDGALHRVIDNAGGIATRDPQAIHSITEGLVMAGVAMGLYGTSRPCSGAEHMLSHYWEMYFLAHGRFPEFHGIKVGIATPIIAQVFAEIDDLLPESVKPLVPKREDMEALLAKIGAPVLPTEIGITKDLFHETMLNAYTVRKRYSVLQLAVDNGRMEQIADVVTERIYG